MSISSVGNKIFKFKGNSNNKNGQNYTYYWYSHNIQFVTFITIA